MFKSAMISLIAALGLATTAWADGIEAHGPHVVAVGAMAQTAAVYMVLHNHGATDDALVSVASDAARRVLLHSTEMSADGVMSMNAVLDPMPLPAEGIITLEQGGYHIMLMGLTAPLEEGDIVALTLTFEQAGDVVVEAVVEPGTGMDHD